MLYSLFVIGTFWFWLLLAAATLFIGVCVTSEKFGKATLCMLGTFLVLALFGNFNVLNWLRDNPIQNTLIGFASYFLIGAVWSVAKWWFFVRRQREEYDELKRGFLKHRGVEGNIIPDHHKSTWRETIAHARGFRFAPTFPPRARHFKGKITAWMTYWPWSMIVTVIDDPIRKLFNAIFNAIQGVFQGISDKAFKNVSGDFEQAPPTPKTGNGTPPPSTPDRHEDPPSVQQTL